MSWLSRLANVVKRDRVADDLDEELRFHAAARADALRAEGQSADEAAVAAQRRLGDSVRLREASLDIKLLPWLDALWRDVAYGARMLRKDAVPSLAAAASLGLAMGACTAAFMLVDALVLRELPVREPGQLIYLALPPTDPSQSREGTSFNYPLFERLRVAAGDRAELSVVGYQSRQRASFHDAPERDDRVQPQFVSGNFFTLLSVGPALGRVLGVADDRPAAPGRVAVLSHAFWQRRFGGDPSVVGRVFTLDRAQQYQIVGVAREDFAGVEPGVLTDVWMPATAFRPEALTSSNFQWFRVWGRLARGVTQEEIGQRLQPAFTQFRRERAASFSADAPEAERTRYINAPIVARSAANGPSFMRLDFERPLWVLAAIAGLVLLLACSNVANLLLARATARDREMALRLSIGAGRRRLVQQLLIESALLAGAACLLGAAFAGFAAPSIVRWLAPADAPAYLDLRFNGRVIAFMVLLGAAATTLFGLAPVVRASAASPIDALKTATGRQGARPRLVQRLVSAQVAFSVMVVFLAGLLLLTFERLAAVDTGFVADDLVLAEVETVNRVDPQTGKRGILDLLERVRAVPGVVSASVSAWSLLQGREWFGAIRLPGRGQDGRDVYFLEVSPGFMQTMGIALHAGRDFSAHDAETVEPDTAIVNEAFARAFFRGRGVLGQRFERAGAQNAFVSQEIVGLAQDAKYTDLRADAPPTVYLPLRGRREAVLQLRTGLRPEAVAPFVRAEAARSTPALVVTEFTLQSTLVDNAMLKERLLARLSGFFALVSLALAAIGLYGVMSYSVVQRTREIGIRLALGARQRIVVSQVLRGIAAHTLIGIAGGMVGGLYLARFMRTLLYEVEPMDPVSLLLPILGLLIVGTLAGVVPARRAACVDPIAALRDE